MITTTDIKNLANLARIELDESEAESLSKEVGAILGYVSQIESMPTAEAGDMPVLQNVMRPDEVTHGSGEYTEAILSNAPAREKSYLKVKKIL